MRGKTTIKKLKQLKKQVKQAQSAPNKRNDHVVHVANQAKRQRLETHCAIQVQVYYKAHDCVALERRISNDCWLIVLDFCTVAEFSSLACTSKFFFTTLSNDRKYWESQLVFWDPCKPISWLQQCASRICAKSTNQDYHVPNVTLSWDRHTKYSSVARLGTCEHLTHLHLSDCDFNLVALNYFKRLTQLTIHCRLYNLGKLNTLSRLQVLNLGETTIDYNSVSKLQHLISRMPNLQEVHLPELENNYNNNYDYDDFYPAFFIEFLASRISLKKLFIPVTCSIVPLLRKLVHLEELVVNTVAVEEAEKVLAVLPQCKNLKVLHFIEDYPSEHFLQQLCLKMQSMNIVDFAVNNCKSLPQGIAQLAKLEHLRCEESGITDIRMVESLLNLQTLIASVSRSKVPLMYSSFPASLKVLNLDGQMIADWSKFSAALAQCTVLTELNLDGCGLKNLADISLALPTSLNKLNLGNAIFSPNSFICSLEQSLSKLKLLKELVLPEYVFDELKESKVETKLLCELLMKQFNTVIVKFTQVNALNMPSFCPEFKERMEFENAPGDNKGNRTPRFDSDDEFA